jgi:hypothetical protein
MSAPGTPTLLIPVRYTLCPLMTRGATRSAALLTVGIGEPNSLVGDAVDVGRAIAHQAVAVTTQIGDPDVVTPDHQDVGFTVRHDWHFSVSPVLNQPF